MKSFFHADGANQTGEKEGIYREYGDISAKNKEGEERTLSRILAKCTCNEMTDDGIYTLQDLLPVYRGSLRVFETVTPLQKFFRSNWN